MTLESFIKKYLGQKVDFDGAYGGQCVDLFRQYVQDVLNLPQPAPVKGARLLWEGFDLDKNLYTYYDQIRNGPFSIPKKGDVVIWNANAGGGYGHVAIFVEGNLLDFTSFDENWPTLDVCTLTKHNYRNIFGWLRPKIDDKVIETLQNEIKSLREHSVVLEDKAEKWYDALKLFDLPSNSKWKPFKDKVNSLFKELETLKITVKDLEDGMATNVTNLNAKKDEKYIYETFDLIKEILERLRR